MNGKRGATGAPLLLVGRAVVAVGAMIVDNGKKLRPASKSDRRARWLMKRPADPAASAAQFDSFRFIHP